LLCSVLRFLTNQRHQDFEEFFKVEYWGVKFIS